MNDKLDESLGPNPWCFISLLPPLFFRTADGVVEVAVDSVAVSFRAFPHVLLQISLQRRRQWGNVQSEGHATQETGMLQTSHRTNTMSVGKTNIGSDSIGLARVWYTYAYDLPEYAHDHSTRSR